MPPIPGTGTPTSQRLDGLNPASPPLPGLPDRDMSASPSTPLPPGSACLLWPTEGRSPQEQPYSQVYHPVAAEKTPSALLPCSSPCARDGAALGATGGLHAPPASGLTRMQVPQAPKGSNQPPAWCHIEKRTEPFCREHFITAEATLHHETELLYS